MVPTPTRRRGRHPRRERSRRGSPRRESRRSRRVEAASVKAAEAEAIDEERRRPVAAGKIAFEHIHVERQPVALELRRLQHHDGIADFRPVRAEHRDGGVRRILGEALIAVIVWRPFLQQVVVSECPAARTGRSAKTIELGATPVSVSFPPCRLAPRAFMTINDGTISGPAWPIVFCSGTCSGVKAWSGPAPVLPRRAGGR